MTTQPTILTPSVNAGPRGRLRTGLILLCILTLALALRSIFFVGPVASDDMRYMRAAQSIATGEMNTRPG